MSRQRDGDAGGSTNRAVDVDVPATVWTRSRSPDNPPPSVTRAPPTPSSVTVSVTPAAVARTVIWTRAAPLCLAALASSSAALK
jgi:hypothetical protein